MQYIHGLIGVIFVIIALLHVPHPSPYIWVPYAIGAVLAFVTLYRGVNIILSRVLAVATTALLFFFFAGFFMEVPKLASDWYTRQEAWAAISMMFGAFAMLSVLSDYSCRCKAESREELAPAGAQAHKIGQKAGQKGFFTAPAEASRSNS